MATSSSSGPVNHKKKKHGGETSSSSGASRPHKKKKSGGGSSSSGGGGAPPTRPEEGDYIINWHLQYCANVLLQAETQLKALSDLVKAELMKIKTDGQFIKENLSGPHQHLVRLRNEDRDLRTILDPINNLSDLLRLVASRSAERII